MNKQELKEMFRKEWKTSYWVEINGFTFFTEDYNISTSSEFIIIYSKETKKFITEIKLEKINSLIMDDEVIL